jgi:hypothetical protein
MRWGIVTGGAEAGATREDRWLIGASAVWAAFVVGVTITTLLHPDRHNVVPVYHAAAARWWQGQPMYGPGIHGFLYLPSFAVLFAPFAALGSPLDDLLWRWAGFALLTLALYRLARLTAGDKWRPVLAVMLTVSLPAAGVDLQSGQATLQMLALMILAAVAIAGERWWPAAAWLGLALAVKPLALVMVLLAAALHPRLRLKLLAAVAVVLLLPVLRGDPGYAAGQYLDAFAKMRVAEDPGSGDWASLDMLLLHAGLDPPGWLLTLLRLAGALAVLALAWQARRRLPPDGAAIMLLALAVTYLLPFNPRAEEGTYLMLAYVLSLFAALAWFVERRRAAGIGFALLCLGLGMQAFNLWLFHATEGWLKPAIGLLFLAILAAALLRPERDGGWPARRRG